MLLLKDAPVVSAVLFPRMPNSKACTTPVTELGIKLDVALLLSRCVLAKGRDRSEFWGKGDVQVYCSILDCIAIA